MKDLIGKIVDNHYRVDAFIASGGMGAVYRVWDLKRNVALAMKVLHDDLADDPTIFTRFEREANALKKLAHPNIVPFYGIRRTSDFVFLLERFIDGPSLKDILRQKKKQPLPIQETLTYFKAICAALGYAHTNGVVHCDVKPGNIMIDQGGNIYLTDFGVARHSDSTKTALGMAGTPAYMAPEQILGKPVTPATDVYSLSVMLFEMLTGQRPFRGDGEGTDKSGDTVHERIRYAHLHLQPPDPRMVNASIPSPVADVILKALSKESSLRYSSAKDFFDALCYAIGTPQEKVSDRVSSMPLFSEYPSPKPSPASLNETSSHVSPPLPKPHLSSATWLWIAGGGAVLVVFFCVLGIYAILQKLPLGNGNSFANTTPITETPLANTTLIVETPLVNMIPTNTAISQATDTGQPISNSPATEGESFAEEFNQMPADWSSFVVNGDSSSWQPGIKNDSLFFNLTSANLGA
ncbi:MAG: serine/threonine protein kinase, partial [Chloroflexi bacterium]|nr:serine/threonine protein kinase [Chloroflexota bacterium]